jgi:glycosyltransferase involved in cell wall biosynthesis
MVIVHVVEPFVSGVAHFVGSLIENMKDDENIVIHGERGSIMRADTVKKDFRYKNVRFIPWKSAQRKISFRMDILALIELCRILKLLKKHNKVDVVHLHSSKSGFIGRMACRIAGIKNIIYTPNGAPFLSSPNPFINYFYNLFEWFGSKMGGEIVCCSYSEWKAYQEAGISAVSINNGIAINAKNSARKIVLSPNKFRIVTSARIVYQKNPELFNSIAEYFSDLAPFEFIWIGDGEQKSLLTAKNIVVTGWLPVSKSRALIESANIYLSTSNFEGLSFAVLEALSLNKPVLLKDCVGNVDQIKQGVNGDIFRDASEAILKILKYYNNPQMMEVMGSYGRSHCHTEFNIKSTYSQYRELYAKNIYP